MARELAKGGRILLKKVEERERDRGRERRQKDWEDRERQ